MYRKLDYSLVHVSNFLQNETKIKRVLLAVAQSRSLPDAPVSCESREKERKKERKKQERNSSRIKRQYFALALPIFRKLFKSVCFKELIFSTVIKFFSQWLTLSVLSPFFRTGCMTGKWIMRFSECTLWLYPAILPKMPCTYSCTGTQHRKG